ncbi:hypothetical protein KJ918_00210, partial [Patescibacteria group bacterium]|nr:hypothetical protein [Patescibacteria group bacterium]
MLNIYLSKFFKKRSLITLSYIIIPTVIVIMSLFLSKLPLKVQAASVSWDAGGDGLTWEDGNNWSTDVVPGSDDDVTIDMTDTININASTTINSLSLGNGSGTTSPTLYFNYDSSGDSLVIDDGNLVVNLGATITHTDAVQGTLNARIDIDIQTGNANIYGDIDVTGAGYEGGRSSSENGYGSGAGTAGTGWNLAGGGGGYGGQGGDASSGGIGGTYYGVYDTPVDLGSGGGVGAGGYDGGDGGGAIKITASGTITVDGNINADGGGGEIPGNCFGGEGPGAGGSGGSIHLIADTIAGSGSITADGGNGGLTCAYSGNGSGGRIMFSFGTTNSFISSGTISGDAGTGGNAGENGTVLVHESTNNDLWIINSQTWHADPLSEGTSHSYRNVYLDNNSVWTLDGYNTTDTDGVGFNFDVVNFSIVSGSTLDLEERGYDGGKLSLEDGDGSGAGTAGTGWNQAGGGGGYGGQGGDASSGGI